MQTVRDLYYTYTSDVNLLHALGSWIKSTYTYDTAGNLIGINYSDSTPSVLFTYDRHGRKTSIVKEGISTNLYMYSFSGLLTNEVVYGSAGVRSIDRGYDSFGRASGINLNNDYDVSYGYDDYGRFNSVRIKIYNLNIISQWGIYKWMSSSQIAGTIFEPKEIN